MSTTKRTRFKRSVQPYSFLFTKALLAFPKSQLNLDPTRILIIIFNIDFRKKEGTFAAHAIFWNKIPPHNGKYCSSGWIILLCVKGSVKWKKRGVWVVSIDSPLIRQYFRRIEKKFLKDPGPLKCIKHIWAVKQQFMCTDRSCGHRVKNSIP
jgi:hypothetical protein